MSDKKNREILESLIWHCRMFLYGCSDSPELLVNEIANSFFQFAMLHLTSTMFITKDKSSDTHGGFFYRALSPMGLEYLLAPIEKVLDSPIGNTTLREFIRSKRNKLCTHGDLSFRSQPLKIQTVAWDNNAIEQFNEAHENLNLQVQNLLKQLELVMPPYTIYERNEMAVKIAIIGHTNSGKTTLIRTLLRRPIGEVDDRPNVTQLSSSQEFKDFYADLVDTPGFQNASGYLVYLRMLEKHGVETAQTIKETIPLDYEEEVVRTIQKCDACVYVASLEYVPDDTILAEIELASSLCKSLIVVLNKNREFARKESKEEAKRRKGLWIEGCKRYGVMKVIDYDAHWASPNVTYSFFEELEKVLPIEKRHQFRQGVSVFKSRQKDLRDKAVEYAIECIIRCRKIDLSNEIRGKPHEADEQYTTRIKKILTETCGDELSEYMNKATSLYTLAAELPTIGIDELGEFDPDIAKMPRAAIAAAVATILGAIFGAAGIIVGLFMTSVTVVSAASVGSAVGGGLGVIIGLAGASGEEDKLRAIQAGYVAIICLNILWILSCYGWGKGAKISENLQNAIDERTKQIIPGIDPINWYKASSDEMKKWIIRFLDRIDDYGLGGKPA